MADLHGRVILMTKSVWHNQAKALTQVALFAYLPAFLIIVATALQPGIPPSVLFEDPNGTLEAPFFVGMLSHTGVVFWAAAATICLFTSALLRRIGGDRRLARFFLASGLLTGYMMWDDLLMFHERLFPVYLSITEGVPKAALLVVILVYLVLNRSTILRSQYTLLGLSLAFLGFSFTVDVSFIQRFIKQDAGIGVESYQYLENGFKLLGIVGWFAYFATFAAGTIAARVAASATEPVAQRENGSDRQQVQQHGEEVARH